ncbi:MAG: hypothetical protein L6V85_06155 [Clostridiales bacterium]|nr:MAG: hypothetical protein L6V85_06155 [Clostridiales bacterium]
MNYKKTKKVLVYGLGASGRSVIKKFCKKIGADVYVFRRRHKRKKEIPKKT